MKKVEEMKNLAVYSDAGRGHHSRVAALSNGFIEGKWQLIPDTKENRPQIMDILSGGVDILVYDGGEKSTLEALHREQQHVVFLHVSDKPFEGITYKYPRDMIVINSSPAADKREYHGEATFLLGLDFALLRAEFLSWRIPSYPFFVSVGDEQLTRAILAMEYQESHDVFGEHSAAEVRERMTRSRIGIVTGGQTLLEIATILPSEYIFAVCRNEEELEQAEYLADSYAFHDSPCLLAEIAKFCQTACDSLDKPALRTRGLMRVACLVMSCYNEMIRVKERGRNVQSV